MKQHPSRNFLIYKIVAENLNEEGLQKELEKYELPKAGKVYLKHLIDEIKKQNINIDESKDVAEVLKSLDIYSLAFPDSYTREAFSYFKKPAILENIKKLLLSRDTPTNIAKFINAKYKVNKSAESIRRFSHYFWNVQIMKIDDWAEILEDKDFSEARKLDKVGPEYARHKLGGFVSKLEIKDSLREIATTLHFDAEVIKHDEETSEKVKSLSMIAKTLIEINEELSSDDTNIKNHIKSLEKVRIEHEEVKIHSITSEASAGNFTGSGRELKEVTPEAEFVRLPSKVIDLG